MAPPLIRRLGYSIDSAVIELFMSLNYESMNEDTFKHFRDNMHASLKLILLCSPINTLEDPLSILSLNR